jgi:hypothetical protein
MRGHTKTFRFGTLLSALAVSTWFIPTDALGGGGGELSAPALPPSALSEDPSDYYRFQDNLWGWAWGRPFTAESYLAAGARAAPTAMGPHLEAPTWWEITAMQGDTTIGTAPFLVLGELDVDTANDTVIEPQLGAIFDIGVSMSLVAGVLYAADGSARSLLAMVAHTAATSDVAPAHTTAVDLFLPAARLDNPLVAADFIEQTGVAMAAAEETDILPCPETDPCECQCDLARAADLADCWLDLRAATILCGLIIVGAIIVCFAVCTAVVSAAPAWVKCMSACLGVGIGIAGNCAKGAVLSYAHCMIRAALAHSDCMRDC